MANVLFILLMMVGAIFSAIAYLYGRASRGEWPDRESPARGMNPAELSPDPEKEAQPSARANRTIKILFLGSAPMDADPLSGGREAREINSKLRESDQGRRCFEVVQEWSARPTDLQAILLRHRPHIVHFSGHGNPSGELIFEDGQGNTWPVQVDALALLFSALKDGIACVVLSACYSEVLAEAIRAHVPCVVGMRTAVADQAAIEFSSSFYLALGHGHSVQKGFELGCAQMALVERLDANTPVLLCRPGIDANKVVFPIEEIQQR